jgi:hypothetical protein
MTTKRKTLTASALAGAIAAATLLAACTTPTAPSSETTSSTQASATTPSTSTSTTSMTQSPEEAAQVLAKAMAVKFYRDRDLGLADPQKTTADFFKGSAVSSALTEVQNSWIAYKGQTLHATGETTLKSVEHLKTDLTNSPKASPPSIPTVQFMVCYDVSKVNVVDKDGKSVVPASRKPTGLVRVGVGNYSYPATDGWRVSYLDKKADSC